jgi:hypothetical protein
VGVFERGAPEPSRISVPMLVDRSLPFHPLVHETLKGAGTWRSEDT